MPVIEEVVDSLAPVPVEVSATNVVSAPAIVEALKPVVCDSVLKTVDPLGKIVDSKADVDSNATLVVVSAGRTLVDSGTTAPVVIAPEIVD